MTKNKLEIINEIDNHIKKEGSSYRNWYVGIASDPEKRLFSDHNVSKQNSWWIYMEAFTDDDARSVENFFLEQRGTQGGPGGGDEKSHFVYAYRITVNTHE